MTDPVAIAYDENGRAYVVEMNDYPYTDKSNEKPFVERTTDEPLGRVRLLEVHLLDRDEDLYGERMRVEFCGWLRGQERYESADELVVQMGLDVARAREVLARSGPSQG